MKIEKSFGAGGSISIDTSEGYSFVGVCAGEGSFCGCHVDILELDEIILVFQMARDAMQYRQEVSSNTVKLIHNGSVISEKNIDSDKQ